MPAPADVTSVNRPQPLRADLRIRDERLESLGLLAGSIAHDFNNLLAPILGYTTLIKEEFPPESSGLQYALSMETAARRAERNIEQTLLATRPQRRFNPRPLEFDKVVLSEIDLWQKELPVNSAIQLTVTCQPAALTADEHHWRIVIRHLLNNARYACATGGSIRIKLEVVQLSAVEMADLGLPESSNLRLTFTDNGTGLTAQAVSRAFDPFFTTRIKGASLGLGLTAAHSVTYLHGGQIELDSAVDRGTEVTIWLPCHYLKKPESAELEPSRRNMAGAPPLVRKKILLLADDLLEREVLKSAFIKGGFETMTPEDRPGAKRLFERMNRDLVFVLASFTIASAEQLNWLQQMQALNGQTPIYLLNADAPKLLAQELAAQNLNVQVIQKPIPLAHLLAAIPQLG